MNGHATFLAWLAGIVTLALSGLGYLHSNFVNVREMDLVYKKLDSIELKLDRLIK